MTDQNKLYIGLGIVLLYIAIVAGISMPYINQIESNTIIVVMLAAILFMLSSGMLLAYLWKGIVLKDHGYSRWLILFVVLAFYVFIYFMPALWFLSITPLIMPFMGFWFARRFFNW
jgi:hypothetical protein